MAYQSLYRRYRPQTFSEIRGQPHVVTALQNAVARDEVGHAYLLHGPRGTGKTTSARVLAKALNCENRGADAEPCGECESCKAIEEGRSFDLHELDAASNNGVDDMRDLLAKVSLGTPGRAKVYILDEVHMLTRGAENALLKTLEEPPAHVVWVLATTEPHKVVPTIRSRCQVFELGLLGAEEMTDHVRWVIADAGLDVDDAAVDHVVAVGGGSVRDTLSALDRVVAAGGVVEIDESTDRLLAALADHDATVALSAVGDALGRGKDPRTIGETVLAGLRDAFLVAMGVPPPRITGPEHARAADLAQRMSPAAMTRALETLGVALVDMRQAPDPRVDLEVALVRLCRPDADRSLDAVIERLERLEAAIGDDKATVAPTPAPQAAPPAEAPPPAPAAETPPPPPAPAADTPSAPRTIPDAPSASRAEGPAAAARQALAAATGGPPSEATPAGPPATPPSAVAMPDPVPAASGDATASGDAAASGDAVPPAPVEGTAPGDALRSIQPTSPRHLVELAAEHLGLSRDEVVRRANELLGESRGERSAADLARLWGALVDAHQGATFGDPPDPEEPPPVAPEEDAPEEDAADDIDLTELIDAPDRADEIVERLTEAFPGAEEVALQEETDR